MKPCPVTGKIKHASRRAAEQHAFKLTGPTGIRRAYRCEHCRAWHITRSAP